jgi:hypothetical protein
MENTIYYMMTWNLFAAWWAAHVGHAAPLAFMSDTREE